MTSDLSVRSWDEPEGIAPRGTLVLLAGRGEHGGVYERLGRRLAADAYRVRALDDPARDPEGTAERVAKALADEASPAPRVLIGVDTGALHAVALARAGLPGLDALVLAGLPGEGASDGGAGADAGSGLGWADELDLRTACPTHRARLEADAGFRRGALAVAPDVLSPALDQVAVPVLALHGADDAVAPLPEARRTYSGFPGIQLVSFAGTRHDVLNDVTHRTVAATLVLFLERLRLSPELPAIAVEEGVAEADGGGTAEVRRLGEARDLGDHREFDGEASA